jgi:hypothetical protein
VVRLIFLEVRILDHSLTNKGITMTDITCNCERPLKVATLRNYSGTWYYVECYACGIHAGYKKTAQEAVSAWYDLTVRRPAGLQKATYEAKETP